MDNRRRVGRLKANPFSMKRHLTIGVAKSYMKKRKITIRLHESQWETLELVASTLKMDKSECIRNSLRFGLNQLLKFETNGQSDIKKLAASSRTASSDNHQKENTPAQKEKQPDIKELYDIYLANTTKYMSDDQISFEEWLEKRGEI